MEPTEASDARTAAPVADRLERLSASARGWHTIQVAVLGFIGICGVLHTAGSSAPRVVQWLAAALAVVALAVACAAIFTVARVAYPVDGDADGTAATPAAASRLRTGIRLTIAALVLVVVAALSGWWPAASTSTSNSTTAAAVAVTTSSGQAWCGALVSGPSGAVSVRTASGVINVPAQVIAQVSPVAQC